MVGDSIADGDVTLLSSYKVPLEDIDSFETAASTAVKTGDGIWLMYEEHEHKDDSGTVRFFTVHFPDNIDQLTEPASVVSDLVSRIGHYRVHTELTRQVADWCSTTALDPDKLAYAYVEYLWLRPGTLTEASELLAQRGDILRAAYGTTSDGNAAAEGFVAMSSPFQVMRVLFSNEGSRGDATKVVRSDLEAKGLLTEWDQLQQKLDAIAVRKEFRSGRYRPRLSEL